MAVVYQNLRQVQHDNGSTAQGAFCIAAPSVAYSTGSVSASTDVFTSKTNKYAESKLIRVIGTAAGHIRFGSSAPTAVTTDFFMAANTAYFFVIASGLEFCAVIPTTGSATFYTEEIY